MSVWGALVAQLGLKPDLRRVGPGTASVDFIGLVAGAWLSLAFDPTGRPRLTIARERALVVMAEEAWRMGPRAQVPGFAGGLRTGDDVFDDAVLVLAQGGHGPLALLDGRTRSRVARLVTRGGGCAPERVWLDPPALAAAQDATQARALIDQAIEVLAALAPPTRETLIDRALSEEPAPVRAAARAGLEGRITAEELLPRLPPEDSPAVVAQILALQPTTEAGLAAWVARLARIPGPEPLQVLVSALAERGRAVPTEAYALLRARLAEGWRAGEPPPEALRRLMAQHRRVVTAVCGAARDAAQPKAAAWLASVPPPPQVAVQLELADTLRDLGHPGAEAAYLALAPSDRSEAQATLGRLATVAGPRAGARVAHLAQQWPALFEEPQAQAELVRRLDEALATDPQPAWPEALAARLPTTVATAVMHALIRRAPQRVAPWLLALPTPDPQAAQQLAGAFAALGDVRAEPRLRQWLEHDVEPVRRAAIEALATCGTLGAVPALERFTGFFAGGELKAAATAAIAAIRARGAISPVGGLSDAAGQGGALSESD